MPVSASVVNVAKVVLDIIDSMLLALPFVSFFTWNF